MSHTSKAKTSQRKGDPAAGLPGTEASQRFPRIAVLALCLLLAGGATWMVMEFVVWNKLPAQLVGKWISKGKGPEASLEFFRNGTMVGHFNVNEDLHIVNARVAVEGDTLFITTRDKKGKNEITRKQIIKTLSADVLVLQDEKERLLRYEREKD